MDLNVTAVDVVVAELKHIQQLHKHPNYYVLSYVVHKYDDAFVGLGRIGAEKDLTDVLYDDVSDDGDYTMMGFGSKLLLDPLLYLQ